MQFLQDSCQSRSYTIASLEQGQYIAVEMTHCNLVLEERESEDSEGDREIGQGRKERI